MRNKILLISALLFVGIAGFSQITGSIIGKVIEKSSKEGFPGVTVVIESDNMIGSRTAVTGSNGDFHFPSIPPGTYTVTATLPGMQTVKQPLVVGVGQTARPTMKMEADKTEETITVVAESNPVLDTTEVSSNFKIEAVENLPRNRTITGIATLAPGVTTTGPSGNPEINGAMSFENQYLVNGAVVNYDNIRGTATNLFIEDAIQETTVISGAVSAEYGQFTGGVVNTITKSGGNQFSGSLRFQLTNDNWSSLTPDQKAGNVELNDKINDVAIATVGGPIIKDRLWFFLAGRISRSDAEVQIIKATPVDVDVANYYGFEPGNPPEARNFPSYRDEDRYEFKLTGNITEGHDVVISYSESEILSGRRPFTRGALTESGLLAARVDPQDFLSINYRGTITPNFMVDVLWSQKNSKIDSDSTAGSDFATGSTFEDFAYNGGANFGAHTFGGLEPELRDNENLNVKFNYFWMSNMAGFHDITFGYRDFQNSRKADNVQSNSNWRLFPWGALWDNDGTNPRGLWVTDPANGIYTGAAYYPILNPSQGSDFTSLSYYVNDSWTLNDNWRFNVGFRYDKNDAFAQDGAPVSDDQKVSPRLAAIFDLDGEGTHVFSLGYNEYVASLSSVGDNVSTAGSPAILYWYYEGPVTDDINVVADWYADNYGTTLDELMSDASLAEADYVSIPGFSTIIKDTLESPSVKETTLGYSTKLSKGYLRADYIHRTYANFYTNRVDMTTGQTDRGSDITELENDPEGRYSRDYDSVQLQSSWRFNDKFSLGGNYSWTQLVGNIVGETSGSGSVSTSGLYAYPEYQFPGSSPVGPLASDIRHNLRLWGEYNLFTSFGKFNFTFLQSYRSGIKYSATANIPTTLPGFPSNPGYTTPPRQMAYFFSPRGYYEMDPEISTDVAMNYTFPFKRFEFFVQFDLLNVFNADKATNNVNTVVTYLGGVEPWNPDFVPVEGVNYRLSDQFGEGVSGGYQTPRTFRMDIGFRF